MTWISKIATVRPVLWQNKKVWKNYK